MEKRSATSRSTRLTMFASSAVDRSSAGSHIVLETTHIDSLVAYLSPLHTINNLLFSTSLIDSDAVKLASLGGIAEQALADISQSGDIQDQSTKMAARQIIDLLRRISDWLDLRIAVGGHTVAITHEANVRAAIVHVLGAQRWPEMDASAICCCLVKARIWRRVPYCPTLSQFANCDALVFQNICCA